MRLPYDPLIMLCRLDSVFYLAMIYPNGLIDFLNVFGLYTRCSQQGYVFDSRLGLSNNKENIIIFQCVLLG